MNKKKRWLLVAVVIVVFCSAMGLYAHFGGTADDTPQQTAPAAGARTRSVLNVNGMILREKTLSDGITLIGNLLPDEEVDLSFETSGKITRIDFREGETVRRGDLLAKVNDSPLLAQLARYQAQIELAQARVYRQNALLEKDAVSQEAYQQAQTELAILEADMNIVRSNIALTELRAPFDGIIGLRNVSLGAYASPNLVVAKLTKISPLKIDLFVPERYASQIKPGTRLTFEAEGINRTFEASVYAKESKVDKATRTLAVRASYPNRGGELQPGRFVTVNIRMQDIADAIAVPTEAIVPEMGVDKVYLYKNGKAHAVPVRTGLRTEAEIQITEGLSAGDTLITSGTLQLREGLPVQLDVVE